MTVPVAASSQTYDIHSFLEQYERDYPDEVVHVDQPLDAAWELTALVTKLEKAKRFPVLICHNVIVDGVRAERLPTDRFLPLAGMILLGTISTLVSRNWRTGQAFTFKKRCERLNVK